MLGLKKGEIIKHFNRSGLLFFTGFSANTEKFKRFSDRFGSDFSNYAGGSHGRVKIKGYEDIAEAATFSLGGPAVGGGCIPAHSEMSYLDNSPKIVWFACSRPAVSSGETTVYDGIKIWDRLSSSTKRLFGKKKIQYTAHYPESKWPEIFLESTVEGVTSICKKNGVGYRVEKLISEKRILHTYYRCWATKNHRFGNRTGFINHILTSLWVESLGASFVKVRFEDSTPIPHDVAIELFETAESIAHEVPWRAGDLIMIDNTWFLHGRREFFGRRDIHIRQCHDPVAEFRYPVRSMAAMARSSERLSKEWPPGAP